MINAEDKRCQNADWWAVNSGPMTSVRSILRTGKLENIDTSWQVANNELLKTGGDVVLNTVDPGFFLKLLNFPDVAHFKAKVPHLKSCIGRGKI